MDNKTIEKELLSLKEKQEKLQEELKYVKERLNKQEEKIDKFDESVLNIYKQYTEILEKLNRLDCSINLLNERLAVNTEDVKYTKNNVIKERDLLLKILIYILVISLATLTGVKIFEQILTFT